MAYHTEATAIVQRIAAVATGGSAELNPAEQVSQQLHDRSLANRCYDSYDDIIDACCEAWNKFTQIPNAIRSLCTRNWANLAPVYGMSRFGIGIRRNFWFW